MSESFQWIQGSVDAEPSDVGYSPETLQRLRNHFEPMLKDNRLQGASYTLARGDKVFANQAVGKLQFDSSKDLQPDSIRHLYSITKIFTATAIMQLAEQGKLYISSGVKDFIEEFDNDSFGGISIFHLLTHTSGYFADPGQMLEPYTRNSWEGGYPKDYNWIKRGLTSPRLALPEERWIYSSFGYKILGEIIQRVSGMEYQEYIKKNILEPLEMDRTFFKVPDALKDQVCVTCKEEREDLDEDYTQKSPPSSGGLLSTCQDLVKFGQALLQNGEYKGQRILGRKSVEAMRTNHLAGKNVSLDYWGAKAENYPYGLGVSFFHDQSSILTSPETFGHEGAGFSVFQVDPKEDLVAVYFIPSALGYVLEAVIGTRNIIWSGLT